MPAFAGMTKICDHIRELLHRGVLVAYDISHPRRFAQALKTVRAYATGGQKSMHECSPLALK